MDDSPSLFEEPEWRLPPLPRGGAPKAKSADVRRTERNNEWLEDGIHPATYVPLKAEPGFTCGGCSHHHVYRPGNRTVHKCDLHRLGQSHSAASDVRVGWPACKWFEAQP